MSGPGEIARLLAEWSGRNERQSFQSWISAAQEGQTRGSRAVDPRRSGTAQEAGGLPQFHYSRIYQSVSRNALRQARLQGAESVAEEALQIYTQTLPKGIWLSLGRTGNWASS